MKLKWNWGTKIALLYTTFVLFILGMVFLAFSQKYDLVTENYYAKELAFQDKIDSRTRYEKLDKKLKITIENRALSINFPHDESAAIKGEVEFFRPSDKHKDFKLSFKTNNNKQEIPLDKFSKGKYLLKLDWKLSEQEFYTERSIIIP